VILTKPPVKSDHIMPAACSDGKDALRRAEIRRALGILRALLAATETATGGSGRITLRGSFYFA
jgi:hypothetical protein